MGLRNQRLVPPQVKPRLMKWAVKLSGCSCSVLPGSRARGDHAVAGKPVGVLLGVLSFEVGTAPWPCCSAEVNTTHLKWRQYWSVRKPLSTSTHSILVCVRTWAEQSGVLQKQKCLFQCFWFSREPISSGSSQSSLGLLSWTSQVQTSLPSGVHDAPVASFPLEFD